MARRNTKNLERQAAPGVAGGDVPRGTLDGGAGDGMMGEVQRLERLATLGTLTASIAHEFNNLLTPILAYGEMAAERPDDIELHQKALARSLDAARRAAEVARAILALAKGEEETVEVGEVAGAVRGALDCVARPLERDGVELVLDGLSPHRVLMSQTLLTQVVMNLVLNARRAVERRPLRLSKDKLPSGRIAMEAGGTGPHGTLPHGTSGPGTRAGEGGGGGSRRVEISAMREGAFVRLVVADSGEGMDAARLAGLFDETAYLGTRMRGSLRSSPRRHAGTPKSAGRGSEERGGDGGGGNGLGLRLCKRFVEAVGGTIAVESEVGKGTRVEVRLRAA